MTNSSCAFGTAARNMLLNGLLALIKLTVGTLAFSEALVSDGVHGVADVLSAVVVMVGIRLAQRQADARHPYGHERMECVAALLLAMMIGLTGVGLGLTGLRSLMGPSSGDTVGTAAIVTALAALGIKEWMFRSTERKARKTASSALMADAWHQRTDVFTSLGGVIGVVGASSGWHWLDPLAACVISAAIVRSAVEIFADAVKRMTDSACDVQTAESVVTVARACDGVCAVEHLRTRLFGSRVIVELTVCVDGSWNVLQAYAVRCEVAKAVKSGVPIVKECTVNIRPLAVANRSRA